MKAHCWFKDKDANIVEDIKEGDQSHLFMASGESEEELGNIWLIDSGCSNHMSGVKTSFKILMIQPNKR